MQGLAILVLIYNIWFHSAESQVQTPGQYATPESSSAVGAAPIVKPKTTPTTTYTNGTKSSMVEQFKTLSTTQDGIVSQFAEVEWVRGIQRRRKAGLEAEELDPYIDIPDESFRISFAGNYSPPWSHDNGIRAQFHWPREDTRELHFVHVPKCGGTSVTKVLRRISCVLNRGSPQTLDCCSPPGFCGAPEKRTCKFIKGCINHFPNLNFVQPRLLPSLTILRSSITRVISSWHYRCHNPNFDCFKVRPNLRTWKMHLNGVREPPGVRNFTFDEFLGMPEYHNIATRMFSRDALPYGGHRGGIYKTGSSSAAPGQPRVLKTFTRDPRPLDPTLHADDLAAARVQLRQFRWVGLMELMGTSLLILSMYLGVPLERDDLVRQRASHTASYHAFAAALHGNVHVGGQLHAGDTGHIARIIAANKYDAVLWDDARSRLCSEIEYFNLGDNPIVLRDLEMTKLAPCGA